MRTSRLWIRLLCLALCLTVLLPCVSALAETTRVAAYLLRLRAAPSDKADVLDAFPRGTTVTILKKGTDWTKVRVRGKVGYMKTNRLAYGRYRTGGNTENTGHAGSGSNSNSTGNISSGSTMYVMKGVRLNLREEPNTLSDIIASFRGGTKVTVLKKGKYWCRVEVKGLIGYMGSNYLTDTYEK